ncbi:TonB-dependent receptor [Aridibaculum aurantiacum]|uniref:TonB-dependent receptor n=1 Tax=Aridibaculum aurantiacum TaxID=2810307 RepID=UPI001A96144C|nr:TonB-dependent receptor [Aridibaculum aurantiacum]
MKLTTQLFYFFLFLLPTLVSAQNAGSITGSVTNGTTLKSIGAATVLVKEVGNATTTDSLGRYRVQGIAPGAYTITVSAIGYDSLSKFNIVVTSGNENEVSFELLPVSAQLQGVVVSTRRQVAKVATLETPLSVQRLTTEEIKAFPGGNFDISKVVQSLPGVGGGASTGGGPRNDIIIRGGAPNENVYYLDGIEIPVINHFSTQGSAGGPQGILNVSFIEDVKLSSSAFDARFDNALSGVFEFKQKQGNPNRVQGNVRLSASELAATLEGPLNNKKNLTFLASARRSYLQVLFKLIDLPIRPNYWDFQYKITYKPDAKSTLTFLGIGAIDEFSFVAPKEPTPEKLYTLESVPNVNQWNYTGGVSYKRSLNNGILNIAISRNAFDNALVKYDNNDESSSSNLRLNTAFRETENKVRADISTTVSGWKTTYGIMTQLVQYQTSSFIRRRAALVDNNGSIVQPADIINFASGLDFWKYGAFVQVGKRFFEERLGISAGLRTDMNSFTTNGTNALATLSPRIAFSYLLSDKVTLNASAGSYTKIPPYTILGFQSNNGAFANRNSDYLVSTHYVTGVEYLPVPTTRFTVEAFYKHYNNAPISVKDGISLSNQGAGFGFIGNEAVVTNGKGNSYGVELFAQQKLTQRFFGTASYTFFYSRYTNADGKYAPSAWDSRHLLSLVGGYKFNRNWELGLKYRFQGGNPYTPYDEVASRANYLSLGRGIEDNARFNTLRLGNFSASDIRIDKKWNFRKLTLDVYLDITNWWAAKAPAVDSYTFKRNANNTAFETTDGQPVQLNGSNAIPVRIDNASAFTLPTIGFIVEF